MANDNSKRYLQATLGLEVNRESVSGLSFSLLCVYELFAHNIADIRLEET